MDLLRVGQKYSRVIGGVDSANLLDIINGYSTFNKENILYLIRNSIVDLEKKASQHIRKMAALEDKSEFDDM